MSAALTTVEARDLRALEKVVQQGIATFHAVGRALLEIRDRRLYRAAYSAFDDYCRDRWKFTRQHALRLIDAAGVVDDVTPIGVIPKESQARELVPLPADDRRAVWTEATADGEQPTASRLNDLVNKVLSQMTPEQQCEALKESERRILERSQQASQRGGDGRAERIAQADRLLARAGRVIAGLGDEAESVLGAVGQVRELLAALSAA